MLASGGEGATAAAETKGRGDMNAPQSASNAVAAAAAAVDASSSDDARQQVRQQAASDSANVDAELSAFSVLSGGQQWWQYI